MKKILKVNLKTCKLEYLNINRYENVMLNDESLVFEAPLLTGYGIVGANRLNVYCSDHKSNSGGYFAHYLKCSGFDYLVLEDRSKEPIYLFIDKNNIKIKKANDILLLNPIEAANGIKKELNDSELEIAALGIAGMNRLDFSKIMFRVNKSCGKNGLGKIMGEKNLKAIAIKKYSTIEVRDKDRLSTINDLMIKKIGEGNILNWFDENNSCCGCLLNCKSTAIKKIMKLGFSLEESNIINDISNEYGMDSVIFADLICNYQRDRALLQKEYYDFAGKIVSKEIDYRKYLNEKNIIKNGSIEIKFDCSFEELGFCKFLINRNIIDDSLREELLSIIM